VNLGGVVAITFEMAFVNADAKVKQPFVYLREEPILLAPVKRSAMQLRRNWRRGKDSNLRVVLPTAVNEPAVVKANDDLSVVTESVQFFRRVLGRKTITVGCPGTPLVGFLKHIEFGLHDTEHRCRSVLVHRRGPRQQGAAPLAEWPRLHRFQYSGTHWMRRLGGTERFAHR